jgi:hypothetical protein
VGAIGGADQIVKFPMKFNKINNNQSIILHI